MLNGYAREIADTVNSHTGKKLERILKTNEQVMNELKQDPDNHSKRYQVSLEALSCSVLHPSMVSDVDAFVCRLFLSRCFAFTGISQLACNRRASRSRRFRVRAFCHRFMRVVWLEEWIFSWSKRGTKSCIDDRTMG